MTLQQKAYDEISRALAHGDEKYGDTFEDSLLKTWAARESYKAIGHITQYLLGRDIDDESGVSHLGLAGARVVRAIACYLEGGSR